MLKERGSQVCWCMSVCVLKSDESKWARRGCERRLDHYRSKTIRIKVLLSYHTLSNNKKCLLAEKNLYLTFFFSPSRLYTCYFLFTHKNPILQQTYLAAENRSRGSNSGFQFIEEANTREERKIDDEKYHVFLVSNYIELISAFAAATVT